MKGIWESLLFLTNYMLIYNFLKKKIGNKNKIEVLLVLRKGWWYKQPAVTVNLTILCCKWSTTFMTQQQGTSLLGGPRLTSVGRRNSLSELLGLREWGWGSMK